MNMPRDRENQIKALDERNRIKMLSDQKYEALVKRLSLVTFELLDSCERCRLMSDDCPAGIILDIENDAENCRVDPRLFIGQAAIQLIRKVDAIPRLNELAVRCGSAIESGGIPIEINIDDLLKTNTVTA